eukprot:TRINITY_DN6064_c0_g1_i1.p1 TRINITY_DN6064_c0_g1~~TRINITY_DN6064_c0_g1_i1.p1  ORF type:complete len:312 (+),score=135.58 TRINITY_DN6064_c0_g1_i1:42-938(+)
MFKAFLKKVEETTDKIGTSLGSSLKLKENNILKDAIQQPPPIVEGLKKALDVLDSMDTSLMHQISLKETPPPPPPSLYRDQVDFHPSGAFVTRYQQKMLELHNNNVLLARKAEAVDRKFPTVIKTCQSQQEAWNRLNNEMCKLPALAATIASIRSQIDTVLVRIDELEGVLDQQVQAHYEAEMWAWKEKQQSDTLRLHSVNQKELDNLEEELGIQRARQLRDIAAKEREEERKRARVKPNISVDVKLPAALALPPSTTPPSLDLPASSTPFSSSTSTIISSSSTSSSTSSSSLSSSTS